jgi:hypothetical protein
MQGKRAANKGAEVDTQRTPGDPRPMLGAEPETQWRPAVGPLNGLGTALIEIYEAGAEHPIKTDLLDQVVSIIRRKKGPDKKGPDERVQEIANLMRDWRQMRRG